MKNIKRIANHLKFLRSALNNWAFYTESNDGIFKNRITLVTHSNKLTLTKQELQKHIDWTKDRLKREME
jgi:hypothetical protein